MTIHVDENFQPVTEVPWKPDDRAHVHTASCVDCQISVLQDDLIEIKETLDLIRTTMLRADTTIATIAAEVKPTLDALTGNPAVRMFLGVKKGDKL